MAIHIIGAGAWGTALAACLSEAGGHELHHKNAQDQSVHLWVRSPNHAQDIAQSRENPRYLAQVRLPPSVVVRCLMEAERFAPTDDEVAIICVPVSGLLTLVSEHGLFLSRCHSLWLAAKGMANPDNRSTPLFPKTLIDDFFNAHPTIKKPSVGLISGPSFAAELARRLPTAVTIAHDELGTAQWVAQLLRRAHFRLYPTDDTQGVAIAGALKNVLALAVGLSDGHQFGENARAALITRGLSEIARLIEAWGGRRETLYGLSGVGDVLLTCMGELSRNRRAGLALARGEAVEAIRARLGTIEGLSTAINVRAWLLAQPPHKSPIEAPLLSAVAQVVSGEQSAAQAMSALMQRPLRDHEFF